MGERPRSTVEKQAARIKDLERRHSISEASVALLKGEVGTLKAELRAARITCEVLEQDVLWLKRIAKDNGKRADEYETTSTLLRRRLENVRAVAG